MTPLERAARALAERAHQHNYRVGNSSQHPQDYARQYWKDYAGQARAVLTAIRKPSSNVCDAGGAAIDAMPSDDFADGHAIAATAFEAMIDAMLEEG